MFQSLARWWVVGGGLALFGPGGAMPGLADEPVIDTTVEVAIEEGVADAAVVSTGATTVGASSDGGPAANDTGSQATHKQTTLININAEGLAESSVQCFCLLKDGSLLAGCAGSKNELRVFDKDGHYVKSIEIPAMPEAINVAPDGSLLVAGEGTLVRLSAEGEEVSRVDSPHTAAIRAAEPEIRKQVIEQHQQTAQMLPQILEQYDAAIKGLEEQIKTLESTEGDQQELEAAKQMLEAYTNAKAQISEQYGRQEGARKELTDEQIAEMVKSSIQYKSKVASISSNGEAVFIATNMPAGYGFQVWRMTPEFTDATVIVSDLSGCCGQMDVQANKDGIFVAENSRKRVRRFDAEGKSICDWGKASEEVDGFGSCCNPMNLAFGADGSVYTAEDTTGRIKRYSTDGKLLSVVGAADVVPGCKKVSIGVDPTRDRVYMLDITRNTVAVLSRVLPDPTEPIAVAEGPTTAGGALLRILGLGN